MNVKQLREVLEGLPDNMDVLMGERLTEFDYGLVNSAVVEAITMYDEFNNYSNTPKKVFVIKDIKL